MTVTLLVYTIKNSFIHTYIHTSGEGRAKYGNDDNDDDERFTIYNSQIELRFTKI